SLRLTDGDISLTLKKVFMTPKYRYIIPVLTLAGVIWYSCSKNEIKFEKQPGDDVQTISTVDQSSVQTAAWNIVNSMSIPRQRHTAVLLSDGKVLVAGGLTVNDATTGSAEQYDPATDAWNSANSMITPRSRHTATLLKDGRVLVVGGRAADGFTSLRSV